jgi:hypothetical protein
MRTCPETRGTWLGLGWGLGLGLGLGVGLGLGLGVGFKQPPRGCQEDAKVHTAL